MSFKVSTIGSILGSQESTYQTVSNFLPHVVFRVFYALFICAVDLTCTSEFSANLHSDLDPCCSVHYARKTSARAGHDEDITGDVLLTQVVVYIKYLLPACMWKCRATHLLRAPSMRQHEFRSCTKDHAEKFTNASLHPLRGRVHIVSAEYSSA